MRALYDNKFIDATISTWTENADYPEANLQDTRLSKVYRSTNDNAQNIVASITAGMTCSYVAIMNHNLTSTATLKIQAMDADSFVDSNDQPDWNHASFEETITITDYMIVHNFTEQTYTHWRIYIDDSTTEGYIQIGGVYLGTFLQMPYMAPNQEIGYNTRSRVSYSESGQVYGDGAYNYREPKIKFSYLNETDRTGMKTMFDEVKIYNPIILIIWESDTRETPIYCTITKPFKFKRSKSYTHKWYATLDCREVF